MKNAQKLLCLAMVLTSAFAIGQDNNDTNEASHALTVDVPEVALLDIWDADANTEAGDKNFDMATATQDGVNREAGTYSFNNVSKTNLWLNYTSVVAGAANASGFDLTRKITVELEDGGTFPESVDLKIVAETPVIVSGGGTSDSAGSVTSGGVRLGATTPIGTAADLVTSIESVYTGDMSNGVKLSYTLEQNGNFSDYKAGSYAATLKYTLTDF